MPNNKIKCPQCDIEINIAKSSLFVPKEEISLKIKNLLSEKPNLDGFTIWIETVK